MKVILRYFLLLTVVLNVHQTFAQKDTLYQNIRGTLRESQLKTPIEGAYIRIKSSTQIYTTTSDSIGKFALLNIPLGDYELLIQLAGFKPIQIKPLSVQSGKENFLELNMEEEFVETGEVVIVGTKEKGSSNNKLITTSVNTLRVEEMNRYAGSRYDPLRMASNFAGVASSGDQRNDIIVRGNSPITVLWKMEGIDIPNPNHFSFTGNSGGGFSVINNNMLSSSDFLTGAFPAEYSNRIGSVFDVKLRKGNQQKFEHAFQFGLNGFELNTEGPISKKRGTSYLLAGRFFTFSFLQAFGFDFGSSGIPQFLDGSFKVSHPFKNGGEWNVWGIIGSSGIDLLRNEKNPLPVVDPAQKYASSLKSDVWAFGTSLDNKLGKKLKGNFHLTYSSSGVSFSNKTTFQSGKEIESRKNKSRESSIIAQYHFVYKINPRHSLKFGVNGRVLFYDFQESSYNYTDSMQVDRLNGMGEMYLYQAFLHWHWRLSENTSLHSGVNAQFFAFNQTSVVEPRLAISSILKDKHTLSFAFGMHSQTMPLYLYTMRFYEKTTGYYQPNRGVDFTKSIHLIGGYKWSINEHWRFKTEIYYQHLYDVPVSMDSSAFGKIFSVLNTGATFNLYAADSLVNEGEGRNYGIELTIERFLKNGFYTMGNVSLFQSEYKTLLNQWYSTAFNIGYVINMLAGKEFKLDKQNRKIFSVDAKVTFMGGQHTNPIDEERSIAEKRQVVDYSNPYSNVLRNYFRFDLKLTYTVNRKKVRHQLFLAADNLFNYKNVLDVFYNFSTNQIEENTQIGIFPYFGYRLLF